MTSLLLTVGTLEQVTEYMNRQEVAMNKYVAYCGGFDKMTKGEELLHNSFCKNWDLLKARRDVLKAERLLIITVN